MLLTIHCPFSSMSITTSLLVSWFPVAFEAERRGLGQALQLPSPLQGLWGKAMSFQLPWTRMVCRSCGLVASTFALSVVASVGMQRKCQPWNSLIPPSVGLNSLPLIQCLSLCALPGVFFFDTMCDLLLLSKCWQAQHSQQSKTVQCVTNCWVHPCWNEQSATERAENY